MHSQQLRLLTVLIPLGAEDDGAGGPGVVIGDLLGEVITQLVAVTTNLVDVPTFIDGSHAISASVNTTSVPVTAAVDSGATLTVFRSKYYSSQVCQECGQHHWHEPHGQLYYRNSLSVSYCERPRVLRCGCDSAPRPEVWNMRYWCGTMQGPPRTLLSQIRCQCSLRSQNTSLIDLIAAGTALNDDGAACDVTSTLGTCAVTETGLTDPRAWRRLRQLCRSIADS